MTPRDAREIISSGSSVTHLEDGGVDIHIDNTVVNFLMQMANAFLSNGTMWMSTLGKMGSEHSGTIITEDIDDVYRSSGPIITEDVDRYVPSVSGVAHPDNHFIPGDDMVSIRVLVPVIRGHIVINLNYPGDMDSLPGKIVMKYIDSNKTNGEAYGIADRNGMIHLERYISSHKEVPLRNLKAPVIFYTLEPV